MTFSKPLPDGPYVIGSGTPGEDMRQTVEALAEVRSALQSYAPVSDATAFATGTVNVLRLPNLTKTYLDSRFDIAKITPGYVTELVGARQTTVAQQIHKHDLTGDFFMTQAFDPRPTENKESFSITRFGPDGVAKNSIDFTDGGHGTISGIQNINGEPYLWVCYETNAAGTLVNDLVRFKWPSHTGNVVWNRSTTGVFTAMNKFESTTTRVYPMIDQLNNWITFYVGGGELLKRRKLTDVEQSINAVYNQIQLTPVSDPSGRQGYLSVDDYVYRYSGTGTATIPRTIERFRWTNVNDRVVLSTDAFGRNPDGTFPGGFGEPEGISLYRDSETGAASIIAGTATDSPGRRRYTAWGWSTPGNAAPDLARNEEAWARTVPVSKSGFARRIRPGILDLSSPTTNPEAPSTNVPPYPSNLPTGVEAYQSYVGQLGCDPVAKPGVSAFSALLLKTYPDTDTLGIVRDCGIGGQSEHKEGRAFDWAVSAYNSKDVATVKLLHDWLLQTINGVNDANFRRFGIMYMIWNKRIYKAYDASAGWQTYTGPNPHTDHVHFSFGWNGAKKNTSWWTGTVAPFDNGPYQ